jgi:hypothetical protein
VLSKEDMPQYQRKVAHPPKEELYALIQTTNFVSLGKTFGVSDNAIRKWCKAYGIPHRKKDLRPDYQS